VPLVSIGMPVYNGEKYLRQAIESILGQTYSNLELVISDNGSTDSTQTIWEEYARRDPRVRCFRHDVNRGATWNYCAVFRHSRGKYFKWASHDDLCAPTFLERCIEVLESDPHVALCTTRTTIINDNGDAVGVYPYTFGVRGNPRHERYNTFHRLYSEADFCNPIFGVFRSDVLMKTPLIESFISSDRVLVGEIALHGEIVELSDPLFQYRDHPGLSWKAALDVGQTLSWYDPTKNRKYVFKHWLILLKHLAQILRVNMSISERLLCLYPIMRWMCTHLDCFTKELVKPVVQWHAVRPFVLRTIREMGIMKIRAEEESALHRHGTSRRLVLTGPYQPSDHEVQMGHICSSE